MFFFLPSRTGKAKPKLCGRWADVNSSMLTIYPPLRPCISKSINVHKGNQARKDDAYNFGMLIIFLSLNSAL